MKYASAIFSFIVNLFIFVTVVFFLTFSFS